MMRGVAAGDPWVAARFVLEIGIACMVAAGQRQTNHSQQPEYKQPPNFRHGEVPAKEAGFIPGMSPFASKILG
jgi:hypothetical protein